MEPFKFNPILKQTIWGGDKIIPFKHINEHIENVGESWEISGVPGSESIVANGPFKGYRLNSLVELLKEKLVGQDNYTRFRTEFPLLIKFIDARQDLSIQVHPNDEIARRQGMEHGKTEMWYMMDSEPGAKIYNGLKQQITPEEYKHLIENDTFCDVLAQYEVKEGDVFYLPAGRIHAICSGCFLVEIQQTSDVTYRIYDYKRKDKNGNYRELHTQLAAESIDYRVKKNYRTEYMAQPNHGISLVRCPYFNTTVYDLDKSMTLDYSELDSFVILIGMKGVGNIKDNEGNVISLSAGETILIPATTHTIQIEGNIKFLETYV